MGLLHPKLGLAASLLALSSTSCIIKEERRQASPAETSSGSAEATSASQSAGGLGGSGGSGGSGGFGGSGATGGSGGGSPDTSAGSGGSGGFGGSGGHGGSGGGIACPSSAEVPKDLWVWSGAAVTDATARARLFDEAANHHVQRVFVETGAGASVLTTNLMATAAADLAAFIDQAAARCLDVELLFGKASWALEDEHAIPLALAAQAVTFTGGLSGAKPKGVHFDIEPHGIHGVASKGTTYDWTNASQRPAMLTQLLDLFHATKATLAGSGLELSADVVFWLDSKDEGFNPLAYGGITKPASEHVIDVVDRAVLMDYRDSAFGVGSDPATSANGIYDLASSEVKYAAATGKPITLGVETGGCDSKTGSLALSGELADNLTFCDEGRGHLETEVKKVLDAYGPAAASLRIAVHHYGSYTDDERTAP